MSLPLAKIAERLQASVERLSDVRERDLNKAANEVLCARTEALDDPCWPKLGPHAGVDVVVGRPPSLVAELKWNQARQDKIYEAIWDAFKIGNLAAQRGCEAWLVTGATPATWSTSWFADLLAEGRLMSSDLCKRQLPGRTGRLAWQDLLIGGRQRAPECVPEHFDLTDGYAVNLTDATGTWELRTVRVVPSEAVLRFSDGWPSGTGRPPSAPRRPVAPQPGPEPGPSHDHRHLLARVAQRVHSQLETGTARGGDGRDFVGRRAALKSRTGEPLLLRLGVAPAGSSMAIQGQGDALFAGPERNADAYIEPGARARVDAAGFTRCRTIGGWHGHWRYWPIEDVRESPDRVADEITAGLRATELLA